MTEDFEQNFTEIHNNPKGMSLKIAIYLFAYYMYERFYVLNRSV